MSERTVRMKKTDLLAKLQENLKDHKQAFEEASKEWALDMAKASKDLTVDPVDEARLQKLSSVWRSKPVSYETSYETAIMQMNMEIREEIELSLHEFNQLVCDEWDWMRQFVSNSYSCNSLRSVKSAK